MRRGLRGGLSAAVSGVEAAGGVRSVKAVGTVDRSCETNRIRSPPQRGLCSSNVAPADASSADSSCRHCSSLSTSLTADSSIFVASCDAGMFSGALHIST
ncbi:hypothetical protein DIPPA_23847 [Diplonema papillatum]|nr:hypothetical protein DIPPA_23847 [Diplonema papillatum]